MPLRFRNGKTKTLETRGLRSHLKRSNAGATSRIAGAYISRFMPTETRNPSPSSRAHPAGPERLAYSLREAADLLGVDYFSVYRLVRRGKLRACRALRGKLLVPRSELLRLLNS